MMERTVETARLSQTGRWSYFDGILNDRTIGMMEALDGFGYITTGMSFLLISMVVFVRAWYVFALTVESDAVVAVLGLVHDLLLVIILLELFRTVINFLKTKVITLEPFLYICVIASTRRILTTGAQISYTDELTDHVFNRYLMDLGANVLIVVALIVAVYVSRRASSSAMVAESEATQRSDRRADTTGWCMRGAADRLSRLRRDAHEAERAMVKAV
jgi:uncharacterized membrane protein (DUF373 family)